MTAIEAKAIRELSGASLRIASAGKRFVRNVSALPQEYPLTPRQSVFLWWTAWTYRRQLSRDVVEEAAKWKDGPMPKSERKAEQPSPHRQSVEELRNSRADAAFARPLTFGDPEQIACSKRRMA